jgi:beta-barrel assembly-enhancing protease
MRYLKHQPAIVFALYAITATGILPSVQPALAQMNRVEALEPMDASEPDALDLDTLESMEFLEPIEPIEPIESPDEPVRSIDQIQQMIDSSTQTESTEPDRHQDERTQDERTQDERTQDERTQDERTQDEAPSPQQQMTAWNQDLYDRAKAELTEEFYTLYRLVDRLSRANQLDESSWQVNLVNGEAQPGSGQPGSGQRANRIMIDSALFDQLYGDVHALACVVGREMAHNVQRHTVITAAERDRVLSQLQDEVVAEVEQEWGVEEQSDRRSSLGGTVLRGVGRLFGGIGTVVTSVADSLIDNHRSDQAAEQAAKRQQEIEERYQSRVAEVEQQWAELAQQQTLTADRYGYEYMTAAGFDPQGCIRAIQIMPSENPIISSNGNFNVADRLEALQPLTPQQEQWKTQGQANLESSVQALTYESFGSNQLRVHSRLQQQGIDQILGN